MIPDAFVEFQLEDAAEAKGKALANSRLFDVHTWSDHPEVDAFVDPLYQVHFAGRKKDIRKRHLKVLLLDLYLAWCEDPERYTAVHRSPNAYRAGSRYNELHISRKTIDVVDALVAGGLIEQEPGFFDRMRGVGRVARIRPMAALQALFGQARFSPFDIGNRDDRLVVELRDADDEKSKPIPYEPTKETERMSAMLHAYNRLLHDTFIDIPTLGEPGEFKDAKGNPIRIHVSQRDKFVRRIFNRGSFNLGGRFYGGWWQNCPKEWRPHIFCNDWPMTEIDYSGLHIVMLYAKEGIAYWRDIGGDPYTLKLPDFAGEGEEARSRVKSLILVALNAKSREQAFSAFRRKAEAGSPDKRLTNDQLGEMLKALEDRHPAIAKYLCEDVGIRLMRADSDISASIITDFTARRLPILCLHDSYLVPSGHEDELRRAMAIAFENVMGVPLIEEDAMKEKADRVEDLEAVLNNWQPYEGFEMEEEERAYRERRYPQPSDRYAKNLKAFKDWMNLREENE